MGGEERHNLALPGTPCMSDEHPETLQADTTPRRLAQGCLQFSAMAQATCCHIDAWNIMYVWLPSSIDGETPRQELAQAADVTQAETAT